MFFGKFGVCGFVQFKCVGAMRNFAIVSNFRGCDGYIFILKGDRSIFECYCQMLRQGTLCLLLCSGVQQH